jgi:hypothetical protein
MRLEMRGVAGLAVAVPLLVVSVSCCKLCLPHTIGDEVSGEPNGSALVKVLVTLKDDADKNCTAQVDPPRVIVFRGSAIRWRVVNNCSRPASSFLQFTRPTPPRAKDGDPEAPRPWDYRFCTGQIANLYAEKDERNVLFCEVPETVVPGLYKYGLDGAAKKDPEIEVRKGGGK